MAGSWSVLSFINGVFMAKSNDSGFLSFGTFFWVLVLACLVYAGFRISPFYYDFYELQNLMQAQADKASVLTDEEMRSNILAKIKELKMPPESAEDLRIERLSDRIEIDTAYDQLFDIDLGDYGYYEIYRFHFEPFAEQQL